MIIFEFFKTQNLIQIYTKTHQIHQFEKFLGGEACLQSPLTNFEI